MVLVQGSIIEKLDNNVIEIKVANFDPKNNLSITVDYLTKELAEGQIKTKLKGQKEEVEKLINREDKDIRSDVDFKNAIIYYLGFLILIIATSYYLFRESFNLTDSQFKEIFKGGFKEVISNHDFFWLILAALPVIVIILIFSRYYFKFQTPNKWRMESIKNWFLNGEKIDKPNF